MMDSHIIGCDCDKCANERALLRWLDSFKTMSEPLWACKRGDSCEQCTYAARLLFNGLSGLNMVRDGL